MHLIDPLIFHRSRSSALSPSMKWKIFQTISFVNLSDSLFPSFVINNTTIIDCYSCCFSSFVSLLTSSFEHFLELIRLRLCIQSKMQLQIKTLSNEKFTIECELTDTVRSRAISSDQRHRPLFRFNLWNRKSLEQRIWRINMRPMPWNWSSPEKFSKMQELWTRIRLIKTVFSLLLNKITPNLQQ